VTMEQWEQAQDLLQVTTKATTRSPKKGRHYVLAGMIRCGSCKRRMEGVWNHGRPYDRCQVHRGERVNGDDHPSTVYIREDALLPGVDAWLAELFTPERLDETCDTLAAATEPDPELKTRHDEIRRRIAELDRELDGYRTVM